MMKFAIIVLLIASASAEVNFAVKGPEISFNADGSGVGFPAAIGAGVSEALTGSLKPLGARVQSGITSGLTHALANFAGGRKALEINDEIVERLQERGLNEKQIQEEIQGLLRDIVVAGRDVDQITETINNFSIKHEMTDIVEKHASEMREAISKFAKQHELQKFEENVAGYINRRPSLGTAIRDAEKDGQELVAEGQEVWREEGMPGLRNFTLNVLRNFGLEDLALKTLANMRRAVSKRLGNLLTLDNMAQAVSTGLFSMGVLPPFNGMIASQLHQMMGGDGRVGGSMSLNLPGMNVLTSMGSSAMNGGLAGMAAGGFPRLSIAGLNGLNGAMNGLSDLQSSMAERLGGNGRVSVSLGQDGGNSGIHTGHQTGSVAGRFPRLNGGVSGAMNGLSGLQSSMNERLGGNGRLGMSVGQSGGAGGNSAIHAAQQMGGGSGGRLGLSGSIGQGGGAGGGFRLGLGNGLGLGIGSGLRFGTTLLGQLGDVAGRVAGAAAGAAGGGFALPTIG